MPKKLLNPFTGEVLNDCGTGAGGFKPGNTCSSGKRSSSGRWDTSSTIGPSSNRRETKSTVIEGLKVTSIASPRSKVKQLSSYEFASEVVNGMGTRKWAANHGVTIILKEGKLGQHGMAVGLASSSSNVLSLGVEKTQKSKRVSEVADHEVSHLRYASDPSIGPRISSLYSEEGGGMPIELDMLVRANAKYGAASVQEEFFAEASSTLFHNPGSLDRMPKTRAYLEELWK